MNFLKKCFGKVKEVVTSSKKAIVAAVALVTVGSSSAFATGTTATLPVVDIDVVGLMTAGLTQLTGYIGWAFGAFIVLALIGLARLVFKKNVRPA